MAVILITTSPGISSRGPGAAARLALMPARRTDSAALAWMRGHGDLVRVGVEGTGSYGAGLARYLAARGIEVAEVIRPNRQARRRRGKSDAADAVAAALAALNGEASGRPKSQDGAVESTRPCRWPAAARSRPAPRRATSSAT